MAEPWLKVGTIRKNQKGNFYIKIAADVSLKTDDVVNVQDPRKKLDESVNAGRISQEKADEFRSKIPEYIKYELYLAPPKTI